MGKLKKHSLKNKNIYGYGIEYDDMIPGDDESEDFFMEESFMDNNEFEDEFFD